MSVNETKKNLRETLAAKTKQVDISRSEICDLLMNGNVPSDKMCEVMDNICSQYKILGILEGELRVMDIVDKTLNVSPEPKETPAVPYF